jgi:AcrR family transcriptional regulator
MRTRAAATQATRERIRSAMLQLFRERWYDEITLAEVAKTAGVALQTVLNHYSSKEGLLNAVLGDPRLLEDFAGHRLRAEAGDVSGAIGLLVDDYERAGDAMVRLLALEARAPSVRPAVDMGRIGHRLWLDSIFDTTLRTLDGAERERRLTQLVCATDVYTWKILRRDHGHTREDTLAAILDMVGAITSMPATTPDHARA